MDALPTVKHEKIKLVEINEYLTCPLCKGYYIDATTISECLHSYCRSCIIQFLQENSHCPICEVIINKAKPNIKLDKTLQDIVYKLVPELFLREMARRQKFYGQRPELAAKVAPEERGEDTERTIFNPKDLISLSIEYISDDSTPGAISVPVALEAAKNSSKICDSNDSQMKRFLQCPGMCRIEVLKKFVQNKYNVNTVLFHIEILYKRVPLPNHYTLIDIAYIYSWKRNEPMKFFFRIMEKSAVERSDEVSNTVQPEVFVKPIKSTRSSDKAKTHRAQNKNKKAVITIKSDTPAAKTEEKVIEDKTEMILNTDKIKDEIKSKLQEIGKGPVYTNITLNRSNNVEIITKVQKVSNKNGQPIGLNIIKQTVKKTTRVPETNDDKVAQVTNGCKAEIRIVPGGEFNVKDDEVDADKLLTKKDDDIQKTLSGDEDGKKVEGRLKDENSGKCEDKENRMEVDDQKPIKIDEKLAEITVRELKPVENHKEESSNVVIQAVLKKEEFDVDEEKSNFLKSIELTARTALQTIQRLKSGDKPLTTNLTPSNVVKPAPKPTQKRKISSPIKNERKKAKKAKTSPVKLLPKQAVAASLERIALLSEKQRNGNDLQSLFSSCKINIPSSLSITLKESSEDDKSRRSAASLKPVQNYIEILKLPDSNAPESPRSEVDNRFKSKSAPSLPCKVNPVPMSEAAAKQQAQTFQRMFEESLKKLEAERIAANGQNQQKASTEEAGTTKRNLMEIASQLQKKTKLEAEKTPMEGALPKVPIPRLNHHQKAKTNPGKFQQTFANLHSPSLGLNYTVSVAQNSGKTSAKIEAKVEDCLRSPTKVEEAQNLVKKEEKKSEDTGRIAPNPQPLKRNSPATSPRVVSAKTSVRPANLSPKTSATPHQLSPKVGKSEGPPQNGSSAAFSPNLILEKYKIQNLAQMRAGLNFSSAVFGMNPSSHLAAIQQAMLINQFELHNRQNWQASQYEQYLKNRVLSKEN